VPPLAERENPNKNALYAYHMRCAAVNQLEPAVVACFESAGESGQSDSQSGDSEPAPRRGERGMGVLGLLSLICLLGVFICSCGAMRCPSPKGIVASSRPSQHVKSKREFGLAQSLGLLEKRVLISYKSIQKQIYVAIVQGANFLRTQDLFGFHRDAQHEGKGFFALRQGMWIRVKRRTPIINDPLNLGIIAVFEDAGGLNYPSRSVPVVPEVWHSINRFSCGSLIQNDDIPITFIWLYRFKHDPRTLVVDDCFGGFNGGVGLSFQDVEGSECRKQTDSGRENQNPSGEIFWPGSPFQVIFCLLVAGSCLFEGCNLSYKKSGVGWGCLACVLNFLGLGFFLLTMIACNENRQEADGDKCSHNGNTVPQKYVLTSPNYRGTVIGIGRTQMANVLPREKQVAVISALAEGSGIRQAERMTGVNRETIMKLGVRVGKGCQTLLDRKMRDLSCQHLQFDELWGFIGKKERHVRPNDNPELGDVWTFCAIDSDTKLVPSFKVGKRDSATANAFVADVASRMANRVQISTDGLRSYVEAVEQAFGSNVDYAQIVKIFEDESMDAEVIGMDKTAFSGRPDIALASTSHVERLNGTTRLHMRRLTRLTYAFSKKRENFEAAVGLHFAYYNFVKRHNSLRMTPAMAAGIERDFWTVRDLVEAAA
jgi:IS1 family transposase